MKKNLVVIGGPTASGKSYLAIKLAKALNGEIISADSMQFYVGMDIGTAKVSLAEQAMVPHHLLDFLKPNQKYSVAEFQTRAEALITDLNTQGKLPIMVGGTGLYINSVIDAYNFNALPQNEEFRQAMRRLKAEHGNAHLHNLLAKADPAAAERLHPNDSQRVIRALEICQFGGKPQSQAANQDLNQVADHAKSNPYNLAYLGLEMPRAELYQRIESRVEQMLAAGLVKEVQHLIEQGYSLNDNAMRGLGYREMHDYLWGFTTLLEAGNLLKKHTRNYAKRQLTWFKRDNRIKWFSIDPQDLNASLAQIEHLAADYIKKQLLL